MNSTFIFRTLAISVMTFTIAHASLAANISVSCRAAGSTNISGCAVGTMMQNMGHGTTWTFVNAGSPITGTDGTQTCGDYEAVITKIDGSVKIKATATGGWQGKPAQWASTPDENKIYTQADLAKGPLVFKFQNACGPNINLSNKPKDSDNQVELQFTEQ